MTTFKPRAVKAAMRNRVAWGADEFGRVPRERVCSSRSPFSDPPRRLRATPLNAALCRRVGVRLDGADMGRIVKEYDVDRGILTTIVGEVRLGTIEPYWRR